jgi:hypothetical protein
MVHSLSNGISHLRRLALSQIQPSAIDRSSHSETERECACRPRPPEPIFCVKRIAWTAAAQEAWTVMKQTSSIFPLFPSIYRERAEAGPVDGYFQQRAFRPRVGGRVLEPILQLTKV